MKSGQRKSRVAAQGLMFAVLAAVALSLPYHATAATGTYSANAGVDLLHLQSLNVPNSFQLEDIGVAPTSAKMSSAGLGGGVNAHGHATNVGANVLKGAIDTEQLVVADHKAPGPPGPVSKTLLSGKIDPLVAASVAAVSAQSVWNLSGCVTPGTAISTATTQLADVQFFTGTPLLTTIDNARGGPVLSRSTVGLVNVAGQSGKGVRSTNVTQLSGITLFKGTPNELVINLVAPPVVTAVANGRPGGAMVTYNHPVLQVLDAKGTKLGELNASSANTEMTIPGVAILRLGKLTKTISAAGTSAAGHAVLLEVKLLSPPAPFDPGMMIAIAGGDVTAVAPAGGVQCSGTTIAGPPAGENPLGGITLACGSGNPLRELQIGPSALQTVAGSTFTYTIAVSNRGDCTLDHVGIVHTVQGPPGSSIVGTTPKADSVSELTATWKDIGPMAPGEVKVLVVSVKVPSGAVDGSKYTGKVDATATSGNNTFKQAATVSGPQVRVTGTGSCSLVGSKTGASHKEVKPGEAFNVYISLLNSGGVPCRNVTVALPMDNGLQFLKCTDGCTIGGRTINWTIAEIGPGSSKTLVATLRVPAGATAGTKYVQSVKITTASGSLVRSAAGPVVSGSSILAPFLAAAFPGTSSVLGAELPRTGAYIALMALIGLALFGSGTILRGVRSMLAKKMH